MFYEGDLQSGIALAVKESKSVICFVRDDNDGSSTWENEYLADEEITQLLEEKAVTLRLNAGSQEAGFLASFCPIKDIPMLVVIKNGAPREYLAFGVTADEFKARLKASLEDLPPTATPQTGQQGSYAATTAPQPTPAQSVSENLQQNSSGGDAAAAQRRADSIRAGKRPAKPPGDEPEDKRKSAQQDWKLQQRKREQQAKDDRARVLNQIQQDKIERKRKEELRKATAIIDEQEANPPSKSTPVKFPQSSASKPQQYRLQVRLFDGSSVRSGFSPSQTIRGDVRPWLDEKRSDGSAPYTLKQILAPLPNRSISVSEEESTLADLNLGATANLVMVPVRSYAEAYVADSSSSSLSAPLRGLYAGYNFVYGIIGAIVGALTTFLGIGQGARAASAARAPTDESGTELRQVDSSTTGSVRGTAGTSGLNIRTLRDQREERGDEQFYNGNQLNFQPRRDSDDNVD